MQRDLRFSLDTGDVHGRRSSSLIDGHDDDDWERDK